MASPSAISNRIDARLKPMNNVSAINPPRARPGGSICRRPGRRSSALLELAAVQALLGAEQALLGLAIGGVGQRHDRLLVLVDDLELAVRLDLADARREPSVEVLRLDPDAALRRVELLALGAFADRIGLDLAGLLDRLLPQEDLEIGAFERVVGDRILAGEGLEIGDELV